MLSLLNVFFHVTHILIIGFILIGWAFKRTRSLHLLLLILTIVSWIGLGFFFGWGYCFWTDWHWEVRDRMGLSHPASYIKLLLDSVTAQNWNAQRVDFFTAALFVAVLVVTVLKLRSKNV